MLTSSPAVQSQPPCPCYAAPHLPSSFSNANAQSISGFTAKSAAREADIESKFNVIPSPDSSTPAWHLHAGTPCRGLEAQQPTRRIHSR